MRQSLGAANDQVRRIILFEAGLLGAVANIAGVTLGLILSLLTLLTALLLWKFFGSWNDYPASFKDYI